MGMKKIYYKYARSIVKIGVYDFLSNISICCYFGIFHDDILK